MSVIENLTFITWSLEHVHLFFILRLFDSDLSADDNNSLVSEFSKNDDSEIEVVYTSWMDED